MAKKSRRPAQSRVRARTEELSRINKALRESEERYRIVLSALVEGVVVIDAAGKILSINPGAERILGFSSKNIIGQSAFDPTWGVLHEDSSPSKPEDFFITASLKTGKAFANVVIGLHRAGGRLIWLNGNTQPPFHPEEKKPYAVVASFFDITTHKEMQAEIQNLNAELEHKVDTRTSELKTAVSELESFSYSVSHDLRAPLRAIEGFSEILLQDHEATLNSEGKRLLGVVRKNALQMAQLIDDLLAFSRIGRKDVFKRRVPMGDLANLIVEDMRASYPLTEITCHPLPDASGDTALLRQVWTNLLSNAFKFTKDSHPPLLEIGAQADPHETIYFVRDNGVGFDMAYAKKLFSVFQRLHSAQEFEGTGVGLAIVQRIITKHGGRVWAESTVTKGATFYFALPSLEATP